MTESDADSEKSITADNEPASKKLAIRQPFQSAPRYRHPHLPFLTMAHGDQDYADNGNDEAHEDREWVRLALAYFLGLKLGDEKFCNAVVDGIVEKMAEAVGFLLSLPASLTNE